MRIVRFLHKRKLTWGLLEEDKIRILRGDVFSGIVPSKSSISLKRVRLAAPVSPSKVVLVGLNYKDHARELKMPVPKNPIIFLKPPTTVIGPEAAIIYPYRVGRVDYEAELALVIKKKCKDIPESKAAGYILGYTCLNDVTARAIQSSDGQWTRSKSFDTFCPIGPWIETEINPFCLKIQSYVNGRLCQDSSTSKFIFPVSFLVSFISRVMTLLPGDIISTGTPAGVGSLKPGDRVEIWIEGIGSLKNPVVASGRGKVR